MKPTTDFLRLSIVLVVALSAAPHYSALGQASGGRIPSAPKSKTPGPDKSSATKRSTAMDRIDGKWWTSGNDFGPSELVITQNGSTVSGTIKWADGRSGTLNGSFTNKRLKHAWSDTSGNVGSGWLELSWANFLGGPWHNQTVKNGSWTLNRIEGQWCFGGDRKRIRKVTHDAAGQLNIVTEYGENMNGHLEGPYLYLDSDDGESLKGEMIYKGNRVNFVNGSYWTWCGK